MLPSPEPPRRPVRLPLATGRRAFGAVAEAYDRMRPGYPPELFRALAEAVPIARARVFEVGPGTGQATRWLLGRRPRSLVALEPDERLADYLAEHLPQAQVLRAAFEEAALPEAAFDLGVAATSFHWLEQAPALARVARLLRPGGWWAMWWNIFQDPGDPDAFQAAAEPLYGRLPRPPSAGGQGAPPFALDRDLRLAQMAGAGLTDRDCRSIPWRVTMDTAQVVGLAATFSQVNQVDPVTRTAFLADLEHLVEDRFGGRVERHFLTVLYLGRKPEG